MYSAITIMLHLELRSHVAYMNITRYSFNATVFKPSCIFIYWQFQGCKLSCEYRLSKFLVSSYVSVSVRVECVGRLASLCFLFRLCWGVCRLFCYDV